MLEVTRIYNTMSRRLEPFAPREAGTVGFYSCVPWVPAGENFNRPGVSRTEDSNP